MTTRQVKKNNNQYGTTHQKVGNEVHDMSEIMIIDDEMEIFFSELILSLVFSVILFILYYLPFLG